MNPMNALPRFFPFYLTLALSTALSASGQESVFKDKNLEAGRPQIRI